MLQSVRTKFIGQAVFGVALVASLGLASLYATSAMSTVITELNKNAGAIRSQMNADMLHDTLRGDVYESLQPSNNAQRSQQLVTETSEHAAELTKTLDELAQMNLNAQVTETLKNVRQPVQQYINTTQAIVKAACTSSDEAVAMLPQFTTSFEMLEKELETLGDQIQSHIQSESTHAVALGAKVQTFTVIGIIGGSLISAALAALLASRVIRPIVQMSREIHAIQQSNNLTASIKVNSRDEIGALADAFNGMLDSLRTLVVQVKQGAMVIDSGGDAISSASQTLAQGASAQASNLQQITTSLERISSQTQQSVRNVQKANTIAAESKQSADRGSVEMKEMSRAVNEIKQSSSEISNIIKVIDEIAFQTNLLALNAAVEAARAGEAGKGFAVVADEVRNLAQRSAEAAKNTAAMIDLSVKRSINGVEIANRVGKALEDITEGTHKVNTILTELASSSTEQASGIGQINQGLNQLDLVIQQNAGNSEELASSAEELSSQVVSLNQLVSHFRVDDETLPAATPTKKAKPTSKSPRAAQRHNAHEAKTQMQDELASF